MTLWTRHRSWLVFLAGMLGELVSMPIRAQNPPPAVVPSAEQVADLLRREPFSLENWPKWRGRLLAWIGARGHNADAAFDAARLFLRGQADAAGNLPQPLAKDSLAWYILGSVYLHEPAKDAEQIEVARKAEQALRRSLQLDPKFARAHRNLAAAIWLQAPQGVDFRSGAYPKQGEAAREIEQARQLDPTLSIKDVEASIVLRRRDFVKAESLFTEALREEPGEVNLARGAAVAIVSRQQGGKRAPAVQQLLDKFPDDGDLICLHGLALAEDDDLRGAAREFARTRRLGVDPASLLSEELVAKDDDVSQHRQLAPGRQSVRQHVRSLPRLP